jgi:hypothetical protein
LVGGAAIAVGYFDRRATFDIDAVYHPGDLDGPLPGVSGAGRITPVSDWTCILDRAGEAPGYVLTGRARARVVAAAGEATM